MKLRENVLKWSILTGLVIALFASNAESAVISRQIVGEGGEEPFYAKFADTKAELKDPEVRKQVGIYVLNQSGELEKVVEGQILFHRIKGPILHRFETTVYNGLHAMAAIVDNRLKIFSLASRLKDPESVIELGSKGAQLLDSATNRVVTLPLIQDAENVNFITGEATKKGQTFVVSIKFPKKDARGNGVTFAGFLTSKENGNEESLEIASNLYVLDYKYYKVTELQNFIAAEDDRLKAEFETVISPLYGNVLALPASSDDRTVTEWRNTQLRMIKNMHGDQRALDELPRINLLTGQRIIPAPPVGLEDGGHWRFEQRYDLLGGKNEVIINGGRDDIKLSGRLNTRTDKKSGGNENYAVFENSNEPNIALFTLNDQLHLILDDTSGKTRIIRVDTEATPTEITFLTRKVGSATYLMLSGRLTNGIEFTTAYELVLTGQQAHIRRAVPVNSIYYKSADELAGRFMDDLNYDGASGELLLFDDLTPLAGNFSKYRAARLENPVARRLNLLESNEDKQIYWYPDTENQHFRVDWHSNRLFIKKLGSSEAPTKLFDVQPDEMTFFAFPLDGSEEDDAREKKKARTYVALLSIKSGDRGRTHSFHVRDLGKTLLVEQHVVLSDTFYSKAELGRRVVLAEDDRYIFDDVTPPQPSISAYDSVYESSGLHIDILASHENKLARRLRRPIDEVELGPSLAVRLYGYGDEITPPSGVYTERKKGAPLIAGQLLSRANESGEKKYFVRRTTVNLPGENGNKPLTFNVSAAIIDPSFGSGSRGYNVQIFVTSPEESSVPFYAKESLSSPSNSGDGQLDQLEAIELRSGKGENSDKVFLIMAFRDVVAHGKILRKGYIAVNPYTVSLPNKKDAERGRAKEVILSATTKPFVIPDMSISHKELNSRLVFEASTGEPCWEMNPDLDTADANYEVLSFLSGKAWKPNLSENPNAKVERLKDDAYRKGQSWKIHGRNSNRAEIQSLNKMDLSEYRQDVLPKITEVMAEMIEPGTPVGHRVFIVDKTLKSFVVNTLLARYIDELDKAQPRRWNYRNGVPLYLFNPADIKEQSTVMENLEGIRDMKGRPVLVVDLQHLSKTEINPTPGSDGFYVRETKAKKGTGPEAETGDVDVLSEQKVPSLMYLLATEGQRIELVKFPKLSTGYRKISTLFIGTREEWASAKAKTPENKYGLFEKVEVIDLGEPTAEMRKGLFRRSLEAPEIKALELQFDSSEIARHEKNLTNEEQLERILDYIVSRSERLASEENRDIFNAFLRLRNQLVRSLLEDEYIRKNRVVDVRYVDRVFTQVFNVPLSLKILPESDPLKKLSKRNAVVEWQKAGYAGAFSLKQQVIETILGQMHRDSGVKVQASFLIVGSSRSGKTFLWETLVKMLGLKKYDFYAKDVAENDDAQAIKIGITESLGRKDSTLDARDLTGAGDVMSLETQLKHLEHFLTRKNGSRGFILFDDIHRFPPRERRILTERIRALLEQEYYVAQSTFDKKIVERPSSGLAVFATLNPPDDVTRIREFDPNWHPWSGEKPHPLILAKAALHDKEVPIEESFFTRWKLPLFIDKFPIGAKSPELVNNIVKLSRDALEDSGNPFLVTPEVIASLVYGFRDENAKTFLSDSSSALIQLIARAQSAYSAPKIIALREGSPLPDLSAEVKIEPYAESKNKKPQIRDHVNQHFVALSFDEGYTGHLELLRLMVDSFRIRVYEELVQELSQSERYALDVKIASSVLAPALYGLGRHMMERPKLPLKFLQLDAYKLGGTSKADELVFHEELKKLADREPTEFFPQGFDRTQRIKGLISAIEKRRGTGPEGFTRQQVLREYVEYAQIELYEAFLATMRLRTTQPFPKPMDWLRSLTPQSAGEASPFKVLAPKLVQVFDRFRKDILDARLYHGVPSENIPDFYDVSRLFGFVLDKAMTRLPWSESTTFMVDSLSLLSDDMNLAQMRGVQDFFFLRPTAIIRPTTRDLMIESVVSSPVVQGIDEKRRDELEKRFQLTCKEILEK